jgi:hypothetical protein
MSEYNTSDMAISLDQRESKIDVPVFANLRANFNKKKITPFIDGKAGAFVTNHGGLYLNASAGCRFSLNEKQAINVSVGYTSEELEFQTFEHFYSYRDMDYYRSDRKLTAEGITIKVGYEF